MWRGVVKGACGPLARDTPRIGTKRQIGSRNCWENDKRQVWNTILKREEAAMGYTHGRVTCIGCQSFHRPPHDLVVIFELYPCLSIVDVYLISGQVQLHQHPVRVGLRHNPATGRVER
jgi:hypothetical protein